MPTTRRRTATNLLRIQAEELAHVTACAQAYGLTPARFIPDTAGKHGPDAERAK